MSGLRYIGTDPATDWLPGVPARDLSEAEATLHPEAAESAFYVAAGAPAGRRKPQVSSEAETPTSPAGPGEQDQE